MKRRTDEEAEKKWREASDLEDQGNVNAGIRRYRAAAQMGSVIAMSNLGNLLDDNVNPAKAKEAIYWYKRAAKRGFSAAAWNLAMHYRNLGQQRWYMHWLRVAAELGDGDAKKKLARMR